MGSGGRRRRAAIAAGFAVSAIPIAVAIDSTPAGAVSITVTTTFDTASDDGQCSLREAITAANTNSPSGAESGECPAGSSTATDTITLGPNTTYDVAPTTNLPDISDDLVIDGNGSTIDSRKTSRVLSIAPGVTAEIDDLTLTHRYSATSVTGRGLINRGITTLRNVTIVDNSEVGFGGGIFNGDDVTGTAADLTIIDSTIENNANIPDGNRVGGGIHNHDRATLTIENSTIRNNTADRTGGGISHRGTHLQIEDSVIEGNRAGTGGGVGVFASPIVVAVPTATLTGVTIVNNEATGGGGIAAIESTVSISQSSVLGNRADHDGGGLFLSQSNALLDTVVIAENMSESRGGGVHSFAGQTTIVATTVRDNEVVGDQSTAHGGGISLSNDQSSITRSTITDNIAQTDNDSVWGGGIVAFGGELIVDETTVSKNRAIGSGFAQALGGGLRRDGPIWVTDSTIDGNAAVAEDATTMADGGGVWLSGGSRTAPLMFVNSTISNNSAERSGGIHQEAGDLSIIATTVTANSSPNLAGGIWVGGDLSITASIVAGNGAVEDMGDFGGTASSGGYNVMGELDLGAPFDGPGDIIIGTGDPLLGPLADNGGPTRTHRPLRGSPALDRVTGTYQDRPTVDQRGIARPQGTHADSGSVEREVVFTSQVPQRFADSRSEDTFDGMFRDTGLRAGGSVWEIDVAGRGQVPTEAAAAIVNVTVVGAVAPGHATVYPCSAKVPTASSINYLPGSVEPNELIAKLSGDGALCITTLTTAHVIVDVVGWASGTSPYVPVDPTRYADSRDEPTFDSQQRHTGIRGGGTTWEIPIAGRGIVPASATAAAVNLTVTAGTDHGFATVHPCGALPLASSLNYGPGITRPNELLAKLSPTGTICVYTSADVHVIVDVVGYLGTTLSYTPIVPARYADSRDEPTFDDLQRHTGIRGGGTTWEIPIAGRGVVPAGAGSATVNLTVTESTAPGHATVYPCGTVPLASSINYAPGVTRPNELVAKLSPTGTICVFTLADVHVIVDVVGHDS